MFAAVLEALKLLGSALTGARKLRSEEREKFAKICEDISAVLETFIAAPRDRRQSLGLCAQLREFVVPIRTLASGTLPSDEINRLALALDGVCDAWASFYSESEAGSHAEERDLDQIVAAAGTFKALAKVVRAQ
jgi:hypothetical protein